MYRYIFFSLELSKDRIFNEAFHFYICLMLSKTNDNVFAMAF